MRKRYEATLRRYRRRMLKLRRVNASLLAVLHKTAREMRKPDPVRYAGPAAESR